MVNSALQYGAACQVEAVHELTGLTIDHYVMFDFSGVVSISQDLGGIPVCVSANVYDPYSHLKLSKGSHTLTGDAALEFLKRTRNELRTSLEQIADLLTEQPTMSSIVV